MPKVYKIGKFLCQESTEEEYYEEIRERELSFKRDVEFFQKQKKQNELREKGNFSELSEHDLALIKAMEECENSHDGVTCEELKEIEDFLFGETDCDDIDFSETEKSENSTLEEWQEKERGE